MHLRGCIILDRLQHTTPPPNNTGTTATTRARLPRRALFDDLPSANIQHIHYNISLNIERKCIKEGARKSDSTVFGIIVDSPDNDRRKDFQVVDAPPQTTACPTLPAIQLPNIKDMHHHCNIFPPTTDASLEKSLQTCRKNHTTVKSVVQWLDPSSKSTSQGTAAIFERFTFGPSVHINAFNDIAFSFSSNTANSNRNLNAEHTKDIQYLHIRGSPPSSPLASYPSISIVTSICLFSADVVSLLSQQLVDHYSNSPTSPLPSSLTNYPLTLNELDSLCRLANTIADVVCTISNSLPPSSHEPPKQVEIILDIPQIQYYLSGPQSHFHIPFISQSWLSIVDSRKAIIEKVYTRAIHVEISRRLPRQKLNKTIEYSIVPTKGLLPILPLITSGISNAGRLDAIPVEHCIATLKTTVKEWDLFLKHLPTSKTPLPETLEDLVFLSYVYELVMPVLTNATANDGGSQKQDTLILQIDNIVESKPYLKAKKWLEEYQKATSSEKKPPKGQKKTNIKRPILIGIYPSERVFYSKDHGTLRSSLHRYDPGLDFQSGSGDGQRVGTAEILEQVYGTDSVRSVLECAREEGLV
ncbi:hypothetical protein H072_4985 [Dactylellina haptotyla CBS 200.50]|uniref:Uncharacterized protein n=1 Tax=Dactylellina haptotyla (strain CBS 200.50) TaxID=1284197 RepID=S8C0K2_DACHA|nr:hypothetical protein H072_4985 [Dactylellina haptotyla CBS 200.50]